MRTAVVIEDDDDIRFLLEATLTQAGFAVWSAPAGLPGVEAVREHDPLVTTVDVSLPDIDGFEVARRVREFSPTYLIMLTGRSEEIDTLMGLDAGADDYVTKPFRPRELRARIEAMLRRPRLPATSPSAMTAPSAAAEPAAAVPHPGQLRAGSPASAPGPAVAPGPGAGSGQATGSGRASGPGPAGASVAVPGSASAPASASPADTADDDVLVHRGLRVDVAAREVHLDGEPVRLTRSEFDILAALLASRRRVLEKNDIVRRLWHDDYDTGGLVTESDRRSVEVHVANLRRKLRDDPARPRFIETVRGVGYRLSSAG